MRQSRNVKVSLNQDVELNGMINNKIIPLELSEDGYFLGKKFDEFNIDFRSPNREKLEKYSTWIQKRKRNREISK